MEDAVLSITRLTRLLAAAAAIVVGSAADASAALKVMTSTQDLAAIVQEVGGDKVTVESIAKGYQDPHFVEAKPSFIVKLHSADLLVVVGRELEIAWLPALITQSRNAKIQQGAPGYLDASQNAKILDIPTGQITRAMGDVHPSGNPHYWLDPENGRRIAQAVRGKLSELSRADAAYFDQRYADFDKRLAQAELRWKAAMAPYKGRKIVTYHRSWTNFADAFGLNVIGYVEPKPGIPPSPSHTLALQEEMKRQGVKIILVEPYFDMKTPNAIARETSAVALKLMPSVGGVKEVGSYLDLFDYDIKLLVSAFGQAGAK
jgi:zinc/manganese transport system substrate-binding protein